MRLNLRQTWGDSFYMGLTGLEVLLGDEMQPFPLELSHLYAKPRGVDETGFGSDVRTLDKLVDGVNSTTDESHMWLIPYDAGRSHILEVWCGTVCWTRAAHLTSDPLKLRSHLTL